MSSKYCAVLATMLIMVAGCGGNPNPETQKAEPKAKVVEVYTVKNGVGALTLPVTGLVEAKSDLQLSFGASGTISQILVSKGSKVTQGQVLATLDTKYYQKELEAAAGQVLRASANRTKVVKGATSEQISQQRLQVQSAEKRFNDSKRILEQNENLFAGGAVSKAELDARRSETEQAEITLKNARIQLDELLKGAQPEEIANVDASLKQAASEAERAKKTLNETKILAPFAGMVVDVMQQAGEMAGPGQSVVHLVDLSNVKVTIDVTNDLIDQYVEGAEVNVSKEGTNSVKGKITFISPVIDAKTGKYRVEVTVPNAEGIWRGGMVATVAVPRKVDGMIVPLESVGISEAKRFVMVVENGILKRRDVQVGHVIEDKIEVISGLKAGDQLLRSGITYFVDGEKVTAKGE